MKTTCRTSVGLVTFVGNEVKVTMTYISWSSDFALYVEDYLMYEHHALGL